MSVVALIEEVRRLGVDLRPDGDALVVRPAGKLPRQLKERLREQKPAILEALRIRSAPYSPVVGAEIEKAVHCRYDWQPGYRGFRLHCVVHNHHAGTSTVFRMISLGRDVLLEMAELGILTGRAAEDGTRVN